MMILSCNEADGDAFDASFDDDDDDDDIHDDDDA